MRVRTMTMWVVAAGLGMSFLPVPWVAITGQQAVISPPRDPREVEIQEKRAAAWKAGGYRAAAAVTGSYRLTRSANDLNADSIAFIIRHSPLIVVGQVMSNRTWLNARGDLITTDYELSVEEALKGGVRPGDKITMSVAGGTILFEDRTRAELHITDMLPPFNGERYILFLRPTSWDPSPEQRRAAHGPIYMPSFEALSLYRVSDRGFLTPKTFSGHRLFKKYAGKPERQLIDDVISAVEAEKAGALR